VPDPSNPLPEKSRPYWLLIAGACVVPAVLDALRSYLTARFVGDGNVDWSDVIFAGVEWIFLGGLTPIAYVLARRFPLSREKLGRNLLVHFAGSLILCFGWATLGIALGLILDRYPARPHLLRGYISWLLTSLPWSVFMYFTVLGCVYAFTYYREVRERETQQARLAAQLAEANLSALRMQLHPHFLFNSLNAITVLVRDERIKEASRMLELLSGLLRQVLQSDKRQVVPLNDELHFIEQYLAIEQVRFSDRLEVVWSVDEAVRDVLVPEFILQPLVENAVRHGVAPRTEKGTIEIDARQDGAELVLQVRDDGPGYSSVAGVGVGIANTRARLQTLYGPAGRLVVSSSEAGGTVAEVRIPVRRSD
jgi:two-component system, LytTR family, sensor kinase